MAQLNNAQTFTDFGFIRKAHSADKTGPAANFWRGEILLATIQPIQDEIEIGRDIESLVIGGHLPMFGKNWRLAYLRFSWTLTPDELNLLDGMTQCVVKVGYLADVDLISGDELAERLTYLTRELPL